MNIKKILTIMFLLVCLFSFTSCDDSNEKVDCDKNPTHEECLDNKPSDKEKVKVTYKEFNGNIISEIEIKKGSSITSFPECVEEGYYYYWDKTLEELTNINEDIVIEAFKYEYYINAKYYVDGVLYTEKSGNYFSEFVIELPTEYENCVWNETSRILDEDDYTYMIEYSLSYTLKSEFSIIFKDGSEVLDLDPKTYEVGNVLELPTYEKEGYYFVGWFLSTISLHKVEEIDETMYGDITLFARFIETVKHKELSLPDAPYHFEDIVKNATNIANAYVYQAVFPESISDKSPTSYDWSTSNSAVAEVSQYGSITSKRAGYCILTAKSKSDYSVVINCVIKTGVEGVAYSSVEEANNLITYKVTFVGKDGENIDEQIVQKGGYAIPPKPLEYEGLAFNGWDKDVYNIKSDTTIQATYIKGTNNYAGKSFSIIGDSISTYETFIPTNHAYFYPYPTADVYDVNKTWWMQVINKVGGSMFHNNSWSGSCVASGGESSSTNSARLKKLVSSGEYADVTLIYMGSNDCNARSGISATSFETSYREMIDKVKDLCKDTEIILFTLPKSNLYPENRRLEFNEIINEIASDYNLKVINLDKVDIRGDLVDSAHPAFSGMKIVAEQVIKELLK